ELRVSLPHCPNLLVCRLHTGDAMRAECATDAFHDGQPYSLDGRVQPIRAIVKRVLTPQRAAFRHGVQARAGCGVGDRPPSPRSATTTNTGSTACSSSSGIWQAMRWVSLSIRTGCRVVSQIAPILRWQRVWNGQP